MDRLFYTSVVLRERQNEISKDLAVRRMLREAKGTQSGMSRPRRLILQFAPVVIIASLIAFQLSN